MGMRPSTKPMGLPLKRLITMLLPDRTIKPPLQPNIMRLQPYLPLLAIRSLPALLLKLLLTGKPLTRRITKIFRTPGLSR